MIFDSNFFKEAASNVLKTATKTMKTSPVTKQHIEKKILYTHPNHLFRIICDVNQYSQFLPFCTYSEIITSHNHNRNHNNNHHDHHHHDNHHHHHQYSRVQWNINNSNSTDTTMMSNHGNFHFDATLRIGFPPLFEEEYISRVNVQPQTFTVETKSLSGQHFDSLRSKWILTEIIQNEQTQTQPQPQPQQLDTRNSTTMNTTTGTNHNNHRNHNDPNHSLCHVDFEVEMTVSDPIIAQVLDQVLQQVAGKQVDAFEQRCKDIPFQY